MKLPAPLGRAAKCKRLQTMIKTHGAWNDGVDRPTGVGIALIARLFMEEDGWWGNEEEPDTEGIPLWAYWLGKDEDNYLFRCGDILTPVPVDEEKMENMSFQFPGTLDEASLVLRKELLSHYSTKYGTRHAFQFKALAEQSMKAYRAGVAYPKKPTGLV